MKTMAATVTIEPNKDILALYRMLAENGVWLVRVHNRHIVHATLVPPETPVEALLGEGPEGDLRDSGKHL